MIRKVMMPSRRRLRVPTVLTAVLAAALFAVARPAARPPAWPPISAEDVAMKDCSRQPGAPAVILFREETTDVDKGTTTVFKRLKILTAGGRDLSNVEIPFVAGYTRVTGIEARVVPPLGPEEPFKGEVLEKTAMRRGRLRLALKTFALPNVDVGSIIDYRYKLERARSNVPAKRLNAMITDLMGAEDRPEEGGARERKDPRTVAAGRWTVQEGLFTKHLTLSYTNGMAGILSILGEGGRLAWASVGMKLGKPLLTPGSARLDMYNIPAFAPEDRMIPEDMARMSIDLFFLDGHVTSGDEFWKLESQDWQKGVEEFIGRAAQLEALAGGVVGDAAEPAEKLQRIYAKVQSFRNLSYEKDLTDQQKKEQQIKDNRRVEDVLAHRYGLRSDITRTFVKLAQAAGFEAEVVRVTARDNKLFRKGYLSFYDQLDSELALVKAGERTLILDPATPFCPFGLVHWSRTNTTGLRPSDDPPAFFTVPASTPNMALTRREAALALDLRGALTGTVKTVYTGQEALVRRLDHLGDDATAWKAALETELTELLPTGSSATLTKVENTGSGDHDLLALFEISVPGAAAATGEKTVLPVFPLASMSRYPFQHASRQFPVSFPYPFREIDDIVITLPEGLTLEVRPPARTDQNDFSAYSLACPDQGPGKLHVQRDFTLKKGFFTVEQYGPLKAAFDSVRTSDEAQVVLAPAKK
jgi:hypothetical protein